MTWADVAAVIPTHDRPELVRRAVDSIRSQSVPVTEIIVVAAGADSVPSLDGIDDDRLRVVPLHGRAGPSRARNVGAAAATAPWIAFCDDDDVWRPNKIERQLGALAGAGWRPETVVSAGVIARSPAGDARWPHRFIGTDEPVGDYLFRTRTPMQGETLLHTSTLLASRELLGAEPFDETMWNHEDWDWLLRTQRRGASHVAVEDHLAVWHLEEERPGLTATVDDWERSLDWAKRQRRLLGERAFSAFCLTVVAGRARASRSTRGVLRAFGASLRGRPRLRNLAWFPLYAVLTPDRRRRLRNSLERRPGVG